MTRRLILAALLAASSAQADQGTAGGLRKGVAECAIVDGDLARLECFDVLAKRHQVDGPQRTESAAGHGETGKWKVVDTTNPIDDTRAVQLILESDSGVSRWGKPIVLVLRCLSDTTDLYIRWNGYLGRDSTMVTTRIGSLRAETRSWGLSTDKQSSFHPRSPIATIKTMVDHGTLLAQVTPYNENPITATFDTSGLGAAIAPLRETCKW